MTTVTLPDDLAQWVEAFGQWLPAFLEISLLRLKTPVREMADALVAFLVTNPSATEVWAYRLPDAQQERVAALPSRESGNVLSVPERLELDEFMQLEGTVRLIKARLASNVALIQAPLNVSRPLSESGPLSPP